MKISLPPTSKPKTMMSTWSIVSSSQVGTSDPLFLARRVKPSGQIKYFYFESVNGNYYIGKQRHLVEEVSILVEQIPKQQIIL